MMEQGKRAYTARELQMRKRASQIRAETIVKIDRRLGRATPESIVKRAREDQDQRRAG